MENIDINYLFSLVGTPFGLATLALIVSGWINVNFDLGKTAKVFIPWVIGIILSCVMLLLGKAFNFGAYALCDFNTIKDWLVFGIVALSPGLMSNGIYDSS